ncbi:MAG: SPOR domain-containing protein [Woeseiaceae bacterium]
MVGRRHIAFLLLLLVAAFPGVGRAAVNVAVDNILVSKTNGISSVQLWPACRMRYVDHSPFGSGLEVRVRVSIGPDCDAIIGEVISERYAPPSLHLANVDEIVFDQLNPRDIFITFRFKEPQKFEVRQHTVGWIELFIDTMADSETLSAATATPLPRAPTPTPPTSSLGTLPSQPARPSSIPDVRPSSRANVPPSSNGDFVVQLGVFDDAGRAQQALMSSATAHFAYRTELIVNGRTWHGLQLGFFDSEAAAEQVVDELRDRFPDAWVRYVDPDEARHASDAGDFRSDNGSAVAAVRVRSDARISTEQMTSLMADGRRALLEKRYADAVRIYTRMLEVPNHEHRPEAREMLGIAFERSRRIEHAIAEYQSFLDEFPDSIGAARVSERLVALDTASAAQATPSLQQGFIEHRQGSGWEIHGGLSHYYWRNQEQLVHDGNYLVSSSGVLGLGDITASRRGQRFDVLARLNGAYQHNLVEHDRTGDIGWVSDAFVDVLDTELGMQGRFGRQTRRTDGVLGRFDGMGLRYQWRPDISFSASTGIPVDSPRYLGNGDRFFYAASASVENLMDGRVTASIFTHQQTTDGISDRQAVGGEVLYRGESTAIFSMLDYDASYDVLNSFLVNATWRLSNDWSLSGRVDVGAEPFLTTRAALSGQPVSSVETLLDTYSEGQIRRLARDRTTQATTVSIGLSAPLGERLDLSLDASLRQADASVESGGVVARPDTGNEIFFNATVAATSLFKDNDLLLVSLRFDSLQSRDSARFMIDSRLPLTRSLRFSPRLVVTHHENTQNAETQTIASPSLRMMWRMGTVLLDVEAGGRWSNRELPLSEIDPFTPDGTEELLGGFVNIGYRWEF